MFRERARRERGGGSHVVHPEGCCWHSRLRGSVRPLSLGMKTPFKVCERGISFVGSVHGSTNSLLVDRNSMLDKIPVASWNNPSSTEAGAMTWQ